LAQSGVASRSIFVLFNGYQVFFEWDTQDFLTAYVNIRIFLDLRIGSSLYMRQPFWRGEEMDTVTVRLTGSVFVLL
jgi:amino acid transporter